MVFESLDHEFQALGVLSATDSLLVAQAKTVIRDFLARSCRDYASGTTIQISRDFELSRLMLHVRLDCSGKRTLFERFLNLLRGY